MVAFDQLIERFANVGNAAETAYAVLREAIVTNALKPGTRLRADELAKKLGVSKTPVREALRKLQAEQLISVSAGNALTVTSISQEQLFEIYYTREALEGMAARLAAASAGQIELAKLHAIHDEMKDSSGNLRQLRQLSGEFQLAVFRAARNDTLYRLLKHLQEQIRRRHHPDPAGPRQGGHRLCEGAGGGDREAGWRRGRGDRAPKPSQNVGTAHQDAAGLGARRLLRTSAA
jgi:DNA-binding GntR family transcriptional regulator